jgi:hypothetical protein
MRLRSDEGELTSHLGDGHDRLKASSIAAAAKAGGVGSLGVADLAGDLERSAIGLAVEHDPGPDAVGGLDVDEVPASTGGAESLLASGSHVREVVDEHGSPGARCQLDGWMQVHPAGENRR